MFSKSIYFNFTDRQSRRKIFLPSCIFILLASEKCYHLIRTGFGFRCLLIIICLTGLLFQTFIISKEYLSGKTVVSVTNGRAGGQTLPAFTICTDNFLSVQKAVQFMPELSKLHSEYRRLQKLIEDDQDKRNDSIDKIVDIYHQFYESIDFTKIPVRQIFMNLSVEQQDKFISILLLGITYEPKTNSYQLINNFMFYDQLLGDPSQPIETL